MPQSPHIVNVVVEAGQSKTFATALDWPGWSRSGRDEASALQALFKYGPRYARVLAQTSLEFTAPLELTAFIVSERLTGNSTTDFGAPNLALSDDEQPVSAAELRRWQEVLPACWSAFDQAVERASGRGLSKGPRGGGRDLDRIVRHLQESGAGYLSSLGGTWKPDDSDDPVHALDSLRQAILTTLAARVDGAIPAKGPRGGIRWTPRYFVRRLAWHELDHTWEIEDRAGFNG